MVADEQAVLRRWCYCRCKYSRPPTAPCACTEADLQRAERETANDTRYQESRLWREHKHDA